MSADHELEKGVRHDIFAMDVAPEFQQLGPTAGFGPCFQLPVPFRVPVLELQLYAFEARALYGCHLFHVHKPGMFYGFAQQLEGAC